MLCIETLGGGCKMPHCVAMTILVLQCGPASRSFGNGQAAPSSCSPGTNSTIASQMTIGLNDARCRELALFRGIIVIYFFCVGIENYWGKTDWDHIPPPVFLTNWGFVINVVRSTTTMHVLTDHS